MIFTHRVNTIKAVYLNYYERKVKALEIDVQITKDNKIVVFHDDVSKYTMKNLSSKYKDIVLFEEFLQHTPEDIMLNVELKRYNKKKDYVNRLIDICRKYNSRQFLYSSFDAKYCKQIAKLDLPVMHLHHSIDTVFETAVANICVHKDLLRYLDCEKYDSIFVYDVKKIDLDKMIAEYPMINGWIVDF